MMTDLYCIVILVQDSIKFVQRLVMEDYNKTKPIPEYTNCSQVMVWRVDTTLLLF